MKKVPSLHFQPDSFVCRHSSALQHNSSNSSNYNSLVLIHIARRVETKNKGWVCVCHKNFPTTKGEYLIM
jgi:hypothetical protein